MNFAANALLAAGASPLMSFCPDEMDELVTLCRALSINIGCLDGQLIEASRRAAAKASSIGRPWVLDPVGIGASRLRRSTAVALVNDFHPTVIRGNASEIAALAGEICGTAPIGVSCAGVDSTVSGADVLPLAELLAVRVGAVVSVSGAVDYITDGKRVGAVADGSPMMPLVTAMGCAATAITAAFLAVDSDPFAAALNAMTLMGKAGSGAASGCSGTGTFAVRFIDELCHLSGMSDASSGHNSAD